MKFYLTYLMTWPELFLALESPTGNIMSYLIAITVSPLFRKLGFAKSLMSHLERVSDERNCYYVDLFVRKSNTNAIGMYESLGYVTYRRIIDYYSGDTAEDGLDMRKSLKMDPDKKAMIPLPKPIHADELEYN